MNERTNGTYFYECDFANQLSTNWIILTDQKSHGFFGGAERFKIFYNIFALFGILSIAIWITVIVAYIRGKSFLG